MATENAAKQGFGARFMHWYESYQGKNITNIVYSVGASVVIIGALFKILHWPGASQVLMVGMFTEAFLFLIGTLEHPHPEFHWENVFPQLLEYGTKPELLEEKSHQARPTLLGAGVAGGAVAATSGLAASSVAPVAAPGEATSAKVPSLKDEDMKALKDGIADLAKTASQFAELGKVAQTGVKLGEKLEAAGVATEAYSSKMSAAGAAVDSYAAATANLAQSYTQVSADMKSVADETKAYKQGVADMGQKLASLNSVYELQLQALNAQTEAQKAVTASAKEAAEAQAAFAAGTKQLHKQVADLNSIYGNMLNALA
ncbi:MAG: gliding motility protein GldL [Paludibacteraceae bacterium]|jgi:gliding motility-associated protein GldL|nr:gliding motility protein GldL [Paludibacteraceae bacterium]